MDAVSLLSVASMTWAVLFVVGVYGLHTCRAMLRSRTAFDLQREAVIAMTRQASFSNLSTHQQAAVLAALYACGPRPGVTSATTLAHLAARSLGSLKA